MQGEYVEKISGGKLLKISVVFYRKTGHRPVDGAESPNKVADRDFVIESVTIRGDFFIHPEEWVEEVEADLKQCPAECVEQRVLSKAGEVVFFGVTPQDIINGIMRCIHGTETA